MTSPTRRPGPIKIVCYSRAVQRFARQLGWFAGASYVRLRDIRGIEPVGFIDIDWKNYDFRKHLAAVKTYRPFITVANDLLRARDLNRTLDQAYELLQWANSVVVVPKDPRLGSDLSQVIPDVFVLGYSVPTKFGATRIQLAHFRDRRVHLLGGRPEIQRRIARSLNVVSLDVNRFTLDARYGDFFDGEIFRPHPIGGYHRCLRDSIRNIEALWRDYSYDQEHEGAVGHKEGADVRSPFAKGIGRTKF